MQALVLTRECISPLSPLPVTTTMYYDKEPVDIDTYHGDRALFDSAWNGVRDYNYSNYRDYSGIGIHEARHWHSRAYGGMGELNQMLPAEIGHAAAYEAYRKWIHHSSMYEPLSADFERQREALIGLAVAETTLLLQYTTRGNDPYTRRSSAEAAAATASTIFFWSREHDDLDTAELRGRSYGSYGAGSYGSGSSYGGDPYAYDADRMYPRQRPRSLSRPGSRSPYRHPLLPYEDRSVSSMPIMANGSSYGSNYDNSYGSSYGGMPMSGSMSMPGSVPSVLPMRGRSMSIMGPGPGLSSYSNGTQYPAMPYGYAPPQTQYVHAHAGDMVLPGGSGPMVLYTKPKKHHHHHHHHGRHGHKKRSRSVSIIDPGYMGY
ncbi:hypothetical protein BDP27DRAFT_1322680 [Rhodocollybia butyracea]|uniref:Uncharacterized protein n=1 Tax=Rhodocollybia butyracea TaxID=206335 RepID=A0A9P5PRR7_9AGAR|nr:hypothetical protein BDP27DRAFT_1322680 [Rhodocollybia butyracea]